MLGIRRVPKELEDKWLSTTPTYPTSLSISGTGIRGVLGMAGSRERGSERVSLHHGDGAALEAETFLLIG